MILQDLGVARVIREKYPELELHASTQMAVHNKQGALALQKLGFSRVVLARELSLAEIRTSLPSRGWKRKLLSTEPYVILTAECVCFRRWNAAAAPIAANVCIPAVRNLRGKR